ncbi:MAG: tetratricopeptide repeat protein [Candidatus Aminicenantes bacterium]|nr:tetratricopeptide repeat protein [Candidatus Aminicenantes bacterium]
MKKNGKIFIWGWICIWFFTAAEAWALNGLAGECRMENISMENLFVLEGDEEMDRFFQAKEHVFKRRWDKAREGFENYLNDFPRGRLRDEALYWLAQSLDMLSKKGRGEEDILTLKEEAVRKLNVLIQDFPKSLWRDDGLALRVEIAAQLVLIGHEEYKSYIDEALRTQKKNMREIKLLALQSMAGLDEDYVLPIYKRLLQSDPDADVRKKIVSLLGSFSASSAMNLIEEAGRSDKDKGVREEATFWMKKARALQIPVGLKYYVYGCRLLDENLYSRFPEEKFNTINLGLSGWQSENAVKRAVRKVFEGKISRFSRSADGTLPASYGVTRDERQMIIMHRAGDFMIWIKPDELDITEDLIQGEVEFRNLRTNKKENKTFLLKKKDSRMIVKRSGDRLSLVTLQFVNIKPGKAQSISEKETSPEPLSKELESLIQSLGKLKGKRQVGKELTLPDHGELEVNAVYTLKPGLRIHTARKYFSVSEFEKDLVNFEQSRAVLPEKTTPSGKEKETGRDKYSNLVNVALAEAQIPHRSWTLLGDIIWLKKRQCLVGHGALILDPDRNIKAQGLILVPLDDPAGYQLLYGKAWIKKQLLLREDERRTRHYYPVLSTNVQGWSVQTVLHSMPSKSSAAKQDFSLAQAARSKNGKDWVLVGRIMLLPKERCFIARQAALICSDGTIVFGTELEVPTDDPAKARVIEKQP